MAFRRARQQGPAHPSGQPSSSSTTPSSRGRTCWPIATSRSDGPLRRLRLPQPLQLTCRHAPASQARPNGGTLPEGDRGERDRPLPGCAGGARRSPRQAPPDLDADHYAGARPPGPGDSLVPRLERSTTLRLFTTQDWSAVQDLPAGDALELQGPPESRPATVDRPVLPGLGRVGGRADQALQADGRWSWQAGRSLARDWPGYGSV